MMGSVPVPDQTAVTCAQIILNDVICRFGCPLSIHSDQGRNYESQVFQELCEILEIRKTRTTPRNPKCNGPQETLQPTW
jgi:transposase InsO family protein